MFIVAETPPRKMLNKKLYVLIAAVAAIAVVLVALFIPQGAAIIPLEVNYTVGETMIYDTIQEVTYLDSNSPVPDLNPGPSSPPNKTISQTTTVEVTDFDGQYYTLNRTTKITHDGRTSDAPLITQKISKQGYTITIFQGNETSGSGTQNPFITEILNRSEVRVGDTWALPITRSTAYGSSSGSMTLTFQGIEDITVPAGTFRVFRVDSTSITTLQKNSTDRILDSASDPTLPPDTWTWINSTASTMLTINQNATMYMEYSTCRQIKGTLRQLQSMQETRTIGNVTLPYSSYEMLLIASTELVQNILP